MRFTERTLMIQDSLRQIIVFSGFVTCPLKCFIIEALILNFPLTKSIKDSLC